MSSRPCKYECGTQLTWDNGKRIFLEPDGTQHTRERCQSLKSKPQAQPPAQPKAESSSDVAIREIRLAATHLVTALKALEENKQ